MHTPFTTVPQAVGRYGGTVRLGSAESQRAAHAVLTTARLDRAVCDALNAGDLPEAERQRLGFLLLSGGTK